MPAILTNIAGPPEQANLAGGEVLQWTAAPPTGGHGVLAIGVISYANNVLVTCHTDKCVFPAQPIDYDQANQRLRCSESLDTKTQPVAYARILKSASSCTSVVRKMRLAISKLETQF